MEMIRLGNRIRLHPADSQRMYEMTGEYPVGIESIGELNAYLDRHIKDLGSQGTPESKMLALLLAGELREI